MVQCKQPKTPSDYNTDPLTISNGKKLFAQNCQSCHSILNEGIGPPIGGITKLLTKDQLKAFILTPAKVINNNDPRALSLLKRYKTRMPSFAHLEESQIENVLSYMSHETELQSLSPFQIPGDSLSDPFISKIKPGKPK